MKKFFAALLCVAAISLVGCKSDPLATGTKGSSLTPEKVEKMDNTTEKCWHIAAKGTVNGHTETSDGYMWCTEQIVAAACLTAYELANERGYGSYDVAYKEETSAKDAEACYKLDQEAEKD